MADKIPEHPELNERLLTDTESHHTAPLKEHAPKADIAAVYEANAGLLHDVLSWFLADASPANAMQEIAQTLAKTLPLSGYSRYANLVCLKTAYEYLNVHMREELSHDRATPAVTGKYPRELSVDEAFCLFLRERYRFSCAEIGAIVGSSEGSIRTRLGRARATLAKVLKHGDWTDSASNKSTPTGPRAVQSLPPSASGSSHTCIRAREVIEDWNVSSAKLGETTAPSHVTRAAADCPKCAEVLEQRCVAIDYFDKLPRVEPSEELRKFPVSPLFIKEGRRILLNWSAAPWYVKAMFEGLLATTLVLGVVLSIPRIKSLYEFWLERRLDLYSVAELAAGLGGAADTNNTSGSTTTIVATSDQSPDSGAAPAAGPNAATAVGPVAPASAIKLPIKPETEFIGRDSEIISSDRIARILIKTDSPESIKGQVARILGTVKYVASDEDSFGAEIPGGVMFDVFIPIKSYKAIAADLVRLGEAKIIITRNKQRGMPGKARLKIWLQRI